MAFTQYGPPELGDWVTQPDFKAQQSKEGGWTATQSFQILRSSIDLETFQDEFRIGRPIEDLSPGIEGFWRFLGLASIPSVEHQEGDYSIIGVKFGGFTGMSSQGTEEEAEVPDEPVPMPTYSLRGSLTERDILLHPKVLALAAPRDRQILRLCMSGKYAYDSGQDKICTHPEDPEGNETFRPIPIQPTAGDARNFAIKVANGEHTYLFPTFIWQKTWDGAAGIAAADMAALGLVDEPDGDAPFPAGNAEGRDWMLVNASQEQDGLKFRNTLEWELSDRGGWDTLLYEV